MPKFWDRTLNRQDRTSNFSAKPKKLKIARTKIISRKKWDWKKWEQKIGPQKFVITRQESSFALLKKNFQMYLRYLLISWQKMGLFTASKCSESSPNIKTELRTSPNISFLTKTELRTSRTSQKTEQFANIELFVPPLIESGYENNHVLKNNACYLEKSWFFGCYFSNRAHYLMKQQALDG